MLDKSEDVALGVAVRIAPACPAMRDDDDLEAALKAFLAIEKPWWRRLLEHGGAVDADVQLLNCTVMKLDGARTFAGCHILVALSYDCSTRSQGGRYGT